MALAGFAILRLAAVAGIGLAAYGLAAPCLSRLRFPSRLEEATLTTALGLGGLGTLLFFAGALGLLFRATVVALLAAGVAGAAWRLVSPRPSRRAETGGAGRLGDPGRIVLAALALAILLPAFVRALYPPTSFDAIMYHLPAARAYAASHRVSPLPLLRYPVFPQLLEMLEAGALLVGDDVTAQLLSWLFFALVAAGLFAWGRRLARPVAGAWAAILWAGSPLVLALAPAAYGETALAAFTLFAFYVLQRGIETRGGAWLGVAGALAGCAAGIKYSGLFVVAILAAALALAARRDRVLRRAAGWFALGAAAFGAPWYLWNAAWTGDPVWPFLARWLGQRYWTAEDVASCVSSLRAYGWGHRAIDLIRLPWNLAFRQPASQYRILPLLFVLLPITAWRSLRDPRRRLLLGGAAGFGLLWFATTQQLRFLVPILPVLVLPTALAIDDLVSRARGVVSAAAEWVLTGLVGGMAAAWAAAHFLGIFRLAPPPVTPGQRDAYLTTMLPTYPFYRDLNRQFGRGYAVYAVRDESLTYYCEGTHLGDWFGPARYADLPLDSARRLAAHLARLNASHLLIRSERIPAALAADPEFRTRFEPISRRGAVWLYRLRD